MVIVSPMVGAGLEKVMSDDVIERSGFILASAQRAKDVQYGSLFH